MSNNARVTKAKGKWGIESFDASPVPLPKPDAAFVRMKHPRERGVYYDSSTGGWVKHGWTVWKRAEWEAKFGGDRERHWEFFGYNIPLKIAE